MGRRDASKENRPGGRIGKKRTEALLQLYRELETELAEVAEDVRSCRDGSNDADDLDSVSEMLTLRLNQITEHRREVKEALERIADRTYGRCEDCGQRIPAARLEANPAAIRCVDCQKRYDAHHP